jgi:hypothetical protein
VESLRARNSGHVYQIGQTRLSLSFGLADVAHSVGSHNSHVNASDSVVDVVHTLVSKVLHTPLFTVMEYSSSAIQLAKVFYIAGRILEGKIPLISLTVKHDSKHHKLCGVRQTRELF